MQRDFESAYKIVSQKVGEYPVNGHVCNYAVWRLIQKFGTNGRAISALLKNLSACYIFILH